LQWAGGRVQVSTTSRRPPHVAGYSPLNSWNYPQTPSLLKTQSGTALLNITPLDLDEWLLQHLDQLIEGEVTDGVLEGVVCNKRIRAKVLNKSISGPVFATVPIVKKTKKLPSLLFTLIAYRIEIA
jgi:hypothetical protein